MLHAANTGHRGLLTTLHAGSASEVPTRLEAMAMSAPGTIPTVVRQLICAIQAVVHLERGPAGRRVGAVAELRTGRDGLAEAIAVRVPDPSGGPASSGHFPSWVDRLASAAWLLCGPPVGRPE